MSETPITQQAEATVTRINQRTERMLTADRNAGGGLADAHEKALRSLVDNPADLKQPVEWVQALAEVHAKFIEEATDALVKTAGEAASDVPCDGVLDEAEAQRIRSLNQQVLAQASAAGTGAVDGYEKALQDMADFETKIAGSSQLDWLQAVAPLAHQIRDRPGLDVRQCDQERPVGLAGLERDDHPVEQAG